MLFFSILAISITCANAIGTISNRNSLKSAIVARQATGPCTSQCATVLSVAANCSTSPDPFCGCSRFVAAAPSCKTCLAQTNSTIGGFLDALAVAEGVVVCNCQSQSCGNLILGSRKCQATDPTNPNCNCPAIVKESACYTCLVANDTSIAATLRGDVARCSKVLSTVPSSTTTVSTSKSTVATFKSAGDILVPVQNSVWFCLSALVVALVSGMFGMFWTSFWI